MFLNKYTVNEPLTPSEREMHQLLLKAFPMPHFFVFPQVSMQAFLTPRIENRVARNRIARKRVDFLICTMSYFVAAVVELDDPSHEGREEQDAERDEMVYSSGLITARFDHIPYEMSPKELYDFVMNPKKERVAAKAERERMRQEKRAQKQQNSD